VVLYYHAVNADERARFAAQMDILTRVVVAVRAEAEGSLDAGRRYAAVTFDDGFVSVIENALPELEAREIPATLFVPTGCWGQKPCWVQSPEARAHRQTVVSVEEVRRLGINPWVTIGSHSVTHSAFVLLDEAQARREFEHSKVELERILGREVALFSFPHGRCNARLIELARSVGYKRVFTISPSWAFRTGSEFVVGRVAVEPSDWPIEFHLKLLGAYRWRCFLRRHREPEQV
jgi:peptidoglycan/xylan/chitin deacetylase (PgdA/CDA1 family)